MILNKKQMTEEDIKLNFITPAINAAGWQNGTHITMETNIYFTDGKINLQGNLVHRKKRKKADYILYITANNPIAVVEAKDNNELVSGGMQQAMEYAQMLDVPFAYSSNGDGFQEHDFFTGKERELALDQFPERDALIARYKKETNGGAGLSSEEEKLMHQPYYTSQDANKPRYYQRIAVNRTLDAIAKGQNRILLVMATGSGKTLTAFQIIYRLLQSGKKHRALYLVDRNFLVDDSMEKDFKPLSKVAHKINFAKDDPTTITSYQMYFALYQQMVGNGGEEHYKELFTPDFFDLIIVDECHRGSAKEESRWRKVLDYFSNATQIGMTATPKETKYISNTTYFGDPIYQYSLNDGIEDGFLAPFKVIEPKINIADGWRPYKGQTDIYGKIIPDRIYNNTDYDYNIIIQDRIRVVAQEITDYLISTGRMQRTIVFCATEDAAERMRIELVNMNSDMVKANPDYVVRITGSDDVGKSKLPYFLSVGSDYPVIATTSDLLSTGADCKMTKLIVLDKNINSMTQFKQIIGRGTRVVQEKGKLSFMVMDFRGVSRLFADPDWDGLIEIDPNYESGRHKPDDGSPSQSFDPDNPIDPDIDPTDPSPSNRYVPVVDKDGCTVKVYSKTVSVYDPHGRLLRQENIIDYTKRNIRGECADLSHFIRYWSGLKKKEEIQDMLKEKGIDLEKLKFDQNMLDVDDFDFICHIAYDQKPLTRKERADNVKKRDYLHKYSGAAREVLEALLDKYMNEGISEIENTEVLRLDPFCKIGKPRLIADLFGGKDGYQQAVKELEDEIYSELEAG